MRVMGSKNSSRSTGTPPLRDVVPLHVNTEQKLLVRF
jgi:hypothetical protein